MATWFIVSAAFNVPLPTATVPFTVPLASPKAAPNSDLPSSSSSSSSAAAAALASAALWASASFQSCSAALSRRSTRSFFLPFVDSSRCSSSCFSSLSFKSSYSALTPSKCSFNAALALAFSSFFADSSSSTSFVASISELMIRIISWSLLPLFSRPFSSSAFFRAPLLMLASFFSACSSFFSCCACFFFAAFFASFFTAAVRRSIYSSLLPFVDRSRLSSSFFSSLSFISPNFANALSMCFFSAFSASAC